MNHPSVTTRRLFLWILGILGCLIVVDVLFGIAMRSLRARSGLKGDYIMIEHVFNGCSDSILVLGSSVALNAIDTRVLADSLSTTAYNAAVNGQQLPFVLTLIKGMDVKGKMPPKILLGIYGADFYTEGSGSRYNILAPYYGQGNPYLDSLLSSRSSVEPLLLRSNLYRYNTAWLRILLYEFLSMAPDNPTGFVAKPVPPVFPARTIAPEGFDSISINPERLSQIKSIMEICRDNGTELTIFFTPLYSFSYLTAIDAVRRLAEDFPSARIWNDTGLQPFAADSTLFYDAIHLNINGAKIYTDTILSRLNPL